MSVVNKILFTTLTHVMREEETTHGPQIFSKPLREFLETEEGRRLLEESRTLAVKAASGEKDTPTLSGVTKSFIKALEEKGVALTEGQMIEAEMMVVEMAREGLPKEAVSPGDEPESRQRKKEKSPTGLEEFFRTEEGSSFLKELQVSVSESLEEEGEYDIAPLMNRLKNVISELGISVNPAAVEQFFWRLVGTTNVVLNELQSRSEEAYKKEKNLKRNPADVDRIVIGGILKSLSGELHRKLGPNQLTLDTLLERYYIWRNDKERQERQARGERSIHGAPETELIDQEAAARRAPKHEEIKPGMMISGWRAGGESWLYELTSGPWKDEYRGHWMATATTTEQGGPGAIDLTELGVCPDFQGKWDVSKNILRDWSQKEKEKPGNDDPDAEYGPVV